MGASIYRKVFYSYILVHDRIIFLDIEITVSFYDGRIVSNILTAPLILLINRVNVVVV